MRPLYIFDLDGTLANGEHRKHHLANKDWRTYFAACDLDTPNVPVVNLFNMLMDEPGVDVWVVSGHSDEVREKTMSWLGLHTRFVSYGDDYAKGYVFMRTAGDHRPDDVVKQEFLDNMLDIDRQRLVAVFDDRDRVVAMWRRNGITCLQVAPGDF